MSHFFKPYEGTRPFLFISYAHRQSDAVIDTIRILHEKGYRLWYDEGIPAGSDWPANIAQHMQNCERVVFFLSQRAMESPNCYSEIRTATRLEKKILVVLLEDAPQDDRWQTMLKDKTVIPLLDTPEERADAILRSGFVPRRYHRSLFEGISWRALGLAASLLFFLTAAGAFGALASGRWNPFPQPDAVREEETVTETPVPVTPPPVLDLGEAERYFAISFPDKQTEKAVRRALGIQNDEIYRWQLAQITELHFCGNMITDGLENVSFDENGICRVNGAQVILGQISDLSLLESASYLEKLSLVCQPLNGLSSISGHVLLRELSLAGSTVDDLGMLRNLPSLEILHLEHTAIRDLSALDGFDNLKTVTVSRGMLPLTWSKDASFRVILVD